MKLTPNFEKDNLLTDYAIGMLKDFYLRGKEKSPQEAYIRASKAWATFQGEIDDDLALRTCKINNYKYAIITENDIIIPPKK